MTSKQCCKTREVRRYGLELHILGREGIEREGEREGGRGEREREGGREGGERREGEGSKGWQKANQTDRQKTVRERESNSDSYTQIH